MLQNELESSYIVKLDAWTGKNSNGFEGPI